MHVDGKLPPINLDKLLARDQEQKRRLGSDPFCLEEIENSAYTPGPADTPVNFAV